MRMCDTDCVPICDFCRHYNFNANKQGSYTGHGYCRFYKKRKEPWDKCRNFWCFESAPKSLLKEKHDKLYAYKAAYRIWKEWRAAKDTDGIMRTFSSYILDHLPGEKKDV